MKNMSRQLISRSMRYYQNPTIDIQLNILIKQVILSYVVNIVEFTKNTSVVINKKVNVSIIFNVANYKYLRIVLEIVKQN